MTLDWDVVVVGGGPAGMMAAGRAAELGARVLLLEKNATLGKKLLTTGGGRCNVTNAEFDTRALLARYGASGKYLSSPFAAWGAKESIDFFESRGMKTKIENEKRVFPVSDSARSVLDVLIAYMKEGGVTVRTRAAVERITAADGWVRSVVLENGEEVTAKHFIFAAGGASRPETGSTGDAFGWLTELGHTVSTAEAALVPIELQEIWPRRAAGVALTGAKVTLMQFGKKQKVATGKILFTHVGLSGPCILNMSRDISELLEYGDVALEIDLFPAVGYEKVDSDLRTLIEGNTAKMFRNALGTLVAPALATPLIEAAGIDPEKLCGAITRVERIRLMRLMKHIPLTVKGLLGLDKAVVTSGGVSLDEIDTRDMRSRRYPNLFVIGDVLDINRPSGGFSLQMCWTTGRIAGEAASHT